MRSAHPNDQALGSDALHSPISVSDFSVSAFSFVSQLSTFPIMGLVLMIAVSAGTFACVLALPAHSLEDAHKVHS
jgi:hypothetical protein